VIKVKYLQWKSKGSYEIGLGDKPPWQDVSNFVIDFFAREAYA